MLCSALNSFAVFEVRSGRTSVVGRHGSYYITIEAIEQVSQQDSGVRCQNLRTYFLYVEILRWAKMLG
jgi:hypothetical protein